MLPCDRTACTQTSRATIAVPKTEGHMGVSCSKHILVVDDAPPVLTTVVSILELEGYSVATAVNGRAALDEIAHRPPDLTFTDLRMPEMDGWAFVAASRALPGPHAPIICMTADEDPARCCRDINADGCLPKPFDLEDLLECAETPRHGHALDMA